MNILSSAQSYKGNKLSQAELHTFASIVQSIEECSKRTPWETMSVQMQEAMIAAKKEANGKREFVKLAKAKTGLLKSNDPWIVWCVANWY